MERFPITNKYVYIALNNVRVKSKSFKVINKNITDALFLDLINNGSIIIEDDIYFRLNDEIELTEYEKEIIDSIGLDDKSATFEEILSKIEKIAPKKLENLSSVIINENIYGGNISIANALINVDINYEDNGRKVKEYRTRYELFKESCDYVKQILETDAYYSLLWLLTQSGDLSKVFNYDEFEILKIKYIESKNNSDLVVKLAQTANTNGLLVTWKMFLDSKNEVFKKGFGLGVVSRYPAFERKESVFISTEKMFVNANESLKIIVSKLVDNGHMVTIVRGGSTPVIDIDNVQYELVTDAVRMRFLNIHGIRLRRYFE